MAAILFRYAFCTGYDVSARADLSAFGDTSQVGEYALEAMQWANSAGLINGNAGNLLPTEQATRAQVAAILTRFCQNIAK